MDSWLRPFRFGLALFAACSLLASAGAQAASRYWVLQGVKFGDGAVATGSFAYDDVTRVVTSWNVSVSDGANPAFFEFTFMPGNSTATATAIWTAVPTIYLSSLAAGAPGEPPRARTLRLTPSQVLDGTPANVPLDVGVASSNVECLDCSPFRAITEGSLSLTMLPPPVGLVDVIEYYHIGLDHYFITASGAEIAALDGGFPAGWTRTGHQFKAFAVGSSGGGPSASPVCRFYANSAATHFYSAIARECRDVAVDLGAYWLQEAGNVFQMELPDTATGACPAGTSPVYRVFNNRADANHRYTTSLVVRAQMEAAGWTREGYGPDAAIMCTRSPV